VRSLLIALNGQLFYIMLPVQLRGGIYQMHSGPPPIEIHYVEWLTPHATVYPIRTFQWRGQIVRQDGSELVDFFEEIEAKL
jgi:hypothetical protein